MFNPSLKSMMKSSAFKTTCIFKLTNCYGLQHHIKKKKKNRCWIKVCEDGLCMIQCLKEKEIFCTLNLFNPIPNVIV